MFKHILFISTFLNRLLFLISKHPLGIGLILIFQTILISLLSRIRAINFWFSYILFLIFVGGLLILFIYVISLASNEIFNFSLKIFINKISLFFIFIFLLYFIDFYLLNFFNKNLESFKLEDSKILTLESRELINKIYNFPRNIITIILIIYLFLCLIAICKIINIFEGPLRPKF